MRTAGAPLPSPEKSSTPIKSALAWDPPPPFPGKPISMVFVLVNWIFTIQTTCNFHANLRRARFTQNSTPTEILRHRTAFILRFEGFRPSVAVAWRCFGEPSLHAPLVRRTEQRHVCAPKCRGAFRASLETASPPPLRRTDGTMLKRRRYALFLGTPGTRHGIRCA